MNFYNLHSVTFVIFHQVSKIANVSAAQSARDR